MDAVTVYKIAKALPKEEQRLLYDMLKKDFFRHANLKSINRNQVLTEEDALEYLLKNVFKNNS